MRNFLLYLYSNIFAVLRLMTWDNVLILYRALKKEKISQILANVNRRIQIVNSEKALKKRNKQSVTFSPYLSGVLNQTYYYAAGEFLIEESFDKVILRINKKDEFILDESQLIRDQNSKIVKYEVLQLYQLKQITSVTLLVQEDNHRLGTCDLNVYKIQDDDILNESQKYLCHVKHERTFIEKNPMLFNSMSTNKIKFLFVISISNQVINALTSLTDSGYPHVDIILVVDDQNDIVNLKELETKYDTICLSSSSELLLYEEITKKEYDFISFIDGEDMVANGALYEMERYILIHKFGHVFYTDNDFIDNSDNRCLPQYKPGISPSLLQFYNYIKYPVFIHSTLCNSIEWYEKHIAINNQIKVELSCKDMRISHIPLITRHLHIDKYNPSFGLDNKPELIKTILSDSITIIIPFKDKVHLLKKCIDSIFDKTKHKNYKILLVNNNSSNPKTLEYLNVLKENSLISIIDFPEEFNYSRINNYAVSLIKSEFIVLLNNDIEVLSNYWLTNLLHYGKKSYSGAVGATLFYPDQTIQHQGVSLEVSSYDDVLPQTFHVNKGKRLNELDAIYTNLPTNPIAVTAACLLMKTELFREVKGLDEKNLKISFNDVDLCLKLVDRGLYNTIPPFVYLTHYESVTRAIDLSENSVLLEEKEHEFLYKKWKKYYISKTRLIGDN